MGNKIAGFDGRHIVRGINRLDARLRTGALQRLIRHLLYLREGFVAALARPRNVATSWNRPLLGSLDP
ncbi:MAG: hypothetical protein LAP39_25540 [Acidobacteriia bacterium]|nr:hypothetical protein [Terriglobia bacterium]